MEESGTEKSMRMLSETAADLHQAGELYKEQGFVAAPPLIPDELVERGIAQMDAVIGGEYETGVAPGTPNWSPGDDPSRLVKMDEPQRSDSTIAELVSPP